ncbi:MAG: Asp-tRNA(Asn)/Glu-tRNA(Gln) amidotransferase subunit GatC [Clostridia bacterium]|nr:Asp-tRNA(Asn)/Glu-tRNA(Gln) amidotransferase subunit GatC [Clostridia bacterium]
MIEKKDILYVAKLAKLSLSEEEIQALTPQMGEIIEFANNISKLDTEGVLPTNHILEIQNVFRKDEVKESYPREDIIKNAPTKEAGCILVPNVVE